MSSVFFIDLEPAGNGRIGPSRYVGSHENRMVWVAVQSLSETPAPYNPLLLCGPSGVGKTMLAMGLSRRWDHESPHRSAFFATGADFARTLCDAYETDGLADLRDRTRGASLFALDNLHELARKTAAQRELAAIVDWRIAARLPSVLTSGPAPQDLSSIDHALLSRLSGGLMVRLTAPGNDARSQLIPQILAHYDFQPEIVSRLTATLESNPLAAPTVPDLHRICQQLVSLAETAPLDQPLLDRCLESRPSDQPTLRSITVRVARHFAVTVTDLRGPSRRQHLVRARSVAMYLSRHTTQTSLEQIGKYFTNRDHTTVMHACRKVEQLLQDDSEIRQIIEQFEGSMALPV